jgi:ureidoglycolate lyase
LEKVITIQPEKLTKENFLPYGEVAEAKGDFKIFNQGNGKMWNNLVHFDMFHDNGDINLGILKTRYLDLQFDKMERHFYTSQIFIPLGGGKSIVAVAPVSDKYPNPNEVKVFLMENNQGVSFYRKVWHHSLFPLNNDQEYILIMRGGDFPPDVESINFPNDVQIRIKI